MSEAQVSNDGAQSPSAAKVTAAEAYQKQLDEIRERSRLAMVQMKTELNQQKHKARCDARVTISTNTSNKTITPTSTTTSINDPISTLTSGSKPIRTSTAKNENKNSSIVATKSKVGRLKSGVATKGNAGKKAKAVKHKLLAPPKPPKLSKNAMKKQRDTRQRQKDQLVLLAPGKCGQEIFTPPRKKGGKYQKNFSPLPIDTTGEKDVFHVGVFMSYCVWILEKKSINYVHSKGFFGKGMLSRGQPCHGESNTNTGNNDVSKATTDVKKSKQTNRKKRKTQPPPPPQQQQHLSTNDNITTNDNNTSNNNNNTTNNTNDNNTTTTTTKDNNTTTKENTTTTTPTKDNNTTTNITDNNTPTTSTNDNTTTSSTTNDTGVTPEYLQLGLEEAFFLSHGLSSLIILDKAKNRLTNDECWKRFRKAQPNFVAKYVVYHHFRSRGWVPKSGLKFGVDFLMYRKGPTFFHSSYAVMVRTADATTLEPSSTTQSTRALNWPVLTNLNRLSSQVAKELVLCTVLFPPELSASDLDDPSCLSKIKVQMVLMRRWIPEKTRHDEH